MMDVMHNRPARVNGVNASPKNAIKTPFTSPKPERHQRRQISKHYLRGLKVQSQEQQESWRTPMALAITIQAVIVGYVQFCTDGKRNPV